MTDEKSVRTEWIPEDKTVRTYRAMVFESAAVLVVPVPSGRKFGTELSASRMEIGTGNWWAASGAMPRDRKQEESTVPTRRRLAADLDQFLSDPLRVTVLL